MRIWLGPAGIPTVAKGSSSVDGIKSVAELGLNAMEIEFVRGVRMNIQLAKECGDIAKKLDVKLSIHAPYYINLASEEKAKIEASKKRILDSVERGHEMKADVVVFHPAYYGKKSKEECYEIVKQNCDEIVDQMKKKGWDDVKLGLETTGKISAFGTLDEIISISREIRECVPVVDFAHLFARNNGKIDYSQILNKIKKFKHINSHFSNINFTEKGERNHLVLDHSLPFEPLAKEILKKRISITIICESPVLEQDSLVMKNIFENLGLTF